MAVQPLNIFSYYNVQRFVQAGSMDAANWYNIEFPDSKSNRALYPAMGRRHIEFMGENKLIFDAEPRYVFRSVNFTYYIVGTRVFQVDKFYNIIQLSEFVSLDGKIYFDFLSVGAPPEISTYCMLTDGSNIFVITERLGFPVTMQKCNDSNAPQNPMYVTVLGDRFIVGDDGSPLFYLSQINLGGVPAAATNEWFTIPGIGPLFAQASGIIRQLGTLNNQMYIFTDFNVDIWANIPTQIQVADAIQVFPFKLNTATNFNSGIADSDSLAIDFGFMVWLAKNESGLITFVMSDGNQPEVISSQAVNVLITDVPNNDISPFLNQESSGFLYQWENSIFYRIIAGTVLRNGTEAIQDSRKALEYNFDTKKWHRVIELDGTRNKIFRHTFFNNMHYVLVEGETAVYEMRGNLYSNEIQKIDDPNTFIKYPMRYELKTAQIYQEDYSEFATDYVEIDFVFGYNLLPRSNSPFLNTVYVTDEDGNFLVTEGSTPGTETFIIKEGTNTPTLDDQHFNYLYNPHIELYYSDDGGITFKSADVRIFGAIGDYSWRMRWYQLGQSRNRTYYVVAVSMFPIVPLGAVQNVRRISGGAN